MKPQVLCTIDRGIGFGDAIMAHSTFRDLSNKYLINAIVPDKTYLAFKLYTDQYNINLYNVTSQSKFYTNDYVKVFNLIYWDVFNTLRNLPNHAINCIRQLANLPLYNKENKEELPELYISNTILNKVNLMLSSLKKPIILVHPLISYYNKMISSVTYLNIIQKLSKIGTIIQIGTTSDSKWINKQFINLNTKTSLEETLAFIKLADIIFCGDTFIQHAAAALKTPTVVFFCGTTPMDFGYPFFKNIFDPVKVPCQLKCGRPMRWLYDYTYSDDNKWDSRNETGWICPTKYCEKNIYPDLILSYIESELKIGKQRDWSFYPIEVSDYIPNIDNSIYRGDI